MKIDVKKIDNGKGKIVYLIECACGEEIVFHYMPDWFKCPSCEKRISLFEIKGGDADQKKVA